MSAHAGEGTGDPPAERANLLGAGLFGVTLLLIPASLVLQFTNQSYYPGGLETSPGFNFHTWFFLYAAALAWGSLRIRPREGRESGYRGLYGAVVVQAVLWCLAWTLALISQSTGWSEAAPALRDLAFAFLLICFFVTPILAGLLLFFSRRGGLLLAGELVPWVYMFVAFATGWAFIT